MDARPPLFPLKNTRHWESKRTRAFWESKRSGNANSLTFSNQFQNQQKRFGQHFTSHLQKNIIQERYEVEDDDLHFGRFQARESNQNNKKQIEAKTNTKSKRKWTFFDQLQSRKGLGSGFIFDSGVSSSSTLGNDAKNINVKATKKASKRAKPNNKKKDLRRHSQKKWSLGTYQTFPRDVEITTEKIGKALGLCWRGDAFEKKVIQKDLSDEDYNVFKFFQGSTQAALTRLIYETPVDTAENKLLFKRAFLIFIQKCFFLATSSPNVTPRSLPTLFDIENTRGRNWALHVHDFLLEEVQKAKVNNTKSIHGCCCAMLIIYFHETYFGKNPSAEEAQPPWIQYWRGSKLKKRTKQEETNSAGLLNIGRLKSEKERLMKKNAKKNHSSKSESESDWESKDESESNGSYQESDSEGTVSDELRQRTRRLPNQNPDQQERRSKKKHASIATQGSSISGVLGSEIRPLARTFDRIKKRKEKDNEDMGSKKAKQTSGDETIASPNAGQSPPDNHDEFIEISSSSDNLNQPSPIKVLVPKAEKVQLSPNEDQPPNVVCERSQPIVDEMVEIWATHSKGENEFVMIFKLRGGNFLGAMRYQFMSMVPKTYIDIGIISLMCHVLNKQAGERFEKLIYCVPPEILQRMFEKYEHEWMDVEKRPHGITTLVNHKEYISYLDKKRLMTRRFLFAPILYSQHWWLYVLDVNQRNIFVIDSRKTKSPSPERIEMNKFAVRFGSV
ncbi:hypothetical protein PIB30_028434 [Stylosanthes scabra]|uniref:Ubiquitin-like protease family profile domain-containing protein n=1 Tax=Stylosanthes scabra TaxID=79078 RepID=A0ABU6WC58_9FABA|nr:hypothetical protein [Stylosanthes scabra]